MPSKLSPLIARVGVVAFFLCCRSASATGPNILANASFEGGTQMWQASQGCTFLVVENMTSARTGSRFLAAEPTKGGSNISQSVPVWPNTEYTTTLYVKGSGQFDICILDSKWSLITSETVSATSGKFTKISMNWNSGANSTVLLDFRDDVASGGEVFVDDVSTGLTDDQAISFNPMRPGASQFKYLIIDDEFDNSKRIDVDATGADGFLWYPQQFFGFPATTPTSYSVSDGALTISDAPVPWSETIHTALPAKNELGWKGTAVAGGDGVYAEARIALCNTNVIGKTGWPAFWMQDMKLNTKVNCAMAGNAGHTEEVENDIFEYNPTWSRDTYVCTLHDWSDTDIGVGTTVCPPVGTDWTQYHTYGMLWIPASAKNNWFGYREAYFDGTAQGAICWKGNQTYTAGVFPETAASMGSYLFSEADHDLFDIIVGSSQGGTPTMRIDYVRVYAVDKSSKVVIP